MDNGMDNMLDMYLYETNTLLEQLDDLLIEAEKNQDFTTEDVNEIFRIMHTIKGSSAMMEFQSLMTIAHHVEDLFFYIRENGMDAIPEAYKSDLFNLMFKSTDWLRAEVEKVENNMPLSTNIGTMTEEINNFLQKISNNKEDNGLKEAPGKDEKMSGEPLPDCAQPYFVRIFFDEGCGMENLRAFMVMTALADEGIVCGYFPENVENDSSTSEAIIENGFFVLANNLEDAQKIMAIVEEQGNIHSYELIENPAGKESSPEGQQDKESAKASGEPLAVEGGAVPGAQKAVEGGAVPGGQKAVEGGAVPGSLKARGSAAEKTAGQNGQGRDNLKQSVKKQASGSAPKKSSPAGAGPAASMKQNLISVNLSKLDSLMAIVGEIVITESMVTSAPEIKNLKLDSFLKSARQLRKLTDDLQDIAMSLRMVPVAATFQKMNRIVRDMNKTLGKNVRLVIEGEDTEVDKSIVDCIADPIMHIVRNSMDHGIEENVQDRIDAGKSPEGTITLSASHTGSEVVISVTDDGRGMDTEKILEKAERNGLLNKPASEYSQKEALALLMLPGFSTNEVVTEFSGRGVGMDVVKKNVESVGGVINITSELGKGSTTTLKIPLTLAIVDGMEIRVGNSIFTIPISNIRQSFKASGKDIIYDAADNEMIKCMDEFYPIIRVNRLYHIENAEEAIEDGILIWVEASDKSYCLFVDELIGEQQVVVKPLPPYLNNFNIKEYGISGCTILGDGNISIILDIASMYGAQAGHY